MDRDSLLISLNDGSLRDNDPEMALLLENNPLFLEEEDEIFENMIADLPDIDSIPEFNLK